MDSRDCGLLFWIALTHNSFGRFYEVQSYGPDVNPNLTLAGNTTSREWYRQNPSWVETIRSGEYRSYYDRQYVKR